MAEEQTTTFVAVLLPEKGAASGLSLRKMVMPAGVGGSVFQFVEGALLLRRCSERKS